MKRRSLALALSTFVLFAVSAHGQDTVTLSGKVTASADGGPLPGATVLLVGSDLSATTAADGRFTLAVPRDKAQGQAAELRITLAGFQPTTVHVRLADAPAIDVALHVGFSEVVVVGSRASGAAAEKAVPVDVISRQEIAMAGASETSQILETLVPSFNFPRTTLSDGADTVRPATLRGLGPDQTLVLLNGKRRHTSAHIPTSGVIGRGSTGADLNAIPASAIERIEVLRDGAAAQYGSDAIAGVVNIVMRSGPQPLTISGKAGLTQGNFTDMRDQTVDHGDGELTEGAASYGFRAGRGSVFVAGEYRNRNGTNRASPDVRDQVQTGDAAANDVTQPNHHWGDSEERNVLGFVSASLPLGQQSYALYAFGTASRRSGSHGGFYRRALDNRNWPSIYPLGFLPTIEPTVTDASATAGLHGVVSNWYFDLSAQYGHDRFRFDVVNSLNTSLGPDIPPNKREFDAGTLGFDHFVGNLDVSRELKAGLAGPLNLALGLEFRRERYLIEAGEPDSYRDGGVPNQFGGRAVPGAQVFPGYRPSNEVDAARSTLAAYVDLEGDVFKAVRIGLAGRFENYSAGSGNPEDDFGSTADGKITVRVEPHRRVVLRAAASTGFRAPSMAQSHFSTVSTNFVDIGGVITPVEIGTFALSSPVAQAMGAEPLQPEESVNLSGGLVVMPTDGLELTLDVYQIELDDRIVLSGNFTGPQIEALTLPFGATGGRFFTNAIDTRTRGLDAIVRYKRDLGDAGHLTLQAAFNKTETEVIGAATTPAPLAGLEEVLFDREQTQRWTCGQPEDNVRLSAGWRRRTLAGTVRVSRYGAHCFATNVAANDQTFGAKWLTDVELARESSRIVLGLGVQNLFDVFPDRLSAANSSFVVQTFPNTSPFGMNGRFLYVRASYRF